MASSAGSRSQNGANQSSKALSPGSLMVPNTGKKSRANNTTQQGKDGSNVQGSNVLYGNKPDPSVLRPAVSVAITGMKQAVKVLETGTPEIRNYLLNECNVIYECKTCFNMFRSLANFISHKRSYCTAKLKDVRHVYHRDADTFTLSAKDQGDENRVPNGQDSDLTTAFVQPEPVETVVPEQEWDLSAYSPSLELMKEAGLIQEIESKPAVSTLLPEGGKKPGLDFIVRQLKAKIVNGPEFDFYKSEEQHVLRLEKMRQSSNAMFQTYGEEEKLMGAQYVELERLKQKPSVFLGPDGRIIDPGAPPTVASFSPASNSSSKENKAMPTAYPCPVCKKDFEKLSNVGRHLVRMHKVEGEKASKLKAKSRKMAHARMSFGATTPEDLIKGLRRVGGSSGMVVKLNTGTATVSATAASVSSNGNKSFLSPYKPAQSLVMIKTNHPAMKEIGHVRGENATKATNQQQMLKAARENFATSKTVTPPAGSRVSKRVREAANEKGNRAKPEEPEVKKAKVKEPVRVKKTENKQSKLKASARSPESKRKNTVAKHAITKGTNAKYVKKKKDVKDNKKAKK